MHRNSSLICLQQALATSLWQGWVAAESQCLIQLMSFGEMNLFAAMPIIPKLKHMQMHIVKKGIASEHPYTPVYLETHP